jgi:hypothetical protein
MSENRKPICPECGTTAEALDRRDFMRVVSAASAAGVLAGAAPQLLAADKTPVKIPEKPAKPAEDLVKELFGSIDEDQKKLILLPWDHGAAKGATATRLRMYNGPIMNRKIGDIYTKTQQELIERILRAISSDEEGYKRVTRNGTFDGSGSFEGCGAMLFGDPKGQWAWVFTGHHLTVRCDGDSEPGAAFGGPIYYGHSPNGYSNRNCFNYQTQAVLSVFDALDGKQRDRAVLDGTPGEQEPSVRFRKPGDKRPGLGVADMTKDQLTLVERVMRTILDPFRKEDGDEVMAIIKATGGMEKIHLAFYRDAKMKDDEPWHFWRLEGPGFVWNYRVLPHVHTYVNISSKV